MATSFGSVELRRALSWRAAALVSFLAVIPGCGSNDDGASDTSAGAATVRAQGGASAGSAAVVRAGAAGANTGTTNTGGGSTRGTAGAASGAAGGVSTSAGGKGAAAGQGGRSSPPEAGADGVSPYERECHGDTIMCEDVATLRCLGIRDDTAVYGYSCSNPCDTDADCSATPSSAAARAACVDFVTQKHCLLVCQDQGMTLACPAGMYCYVYPQSPIGYCLWH